MSDVIQLINGCVVHHGKHNDRTYLMKLGTGSVGKTIDLLEDMVKRNGYSKAVAKIPQPAAEEFRRHGYVFEAKVPGLYKGAVDGYFAAKYLSTDRRERSHAKKITDVLAAAHEKAVVDSIPALPPEFTCAEADESDAPEISAVYREVFASYPFPIHEPDYILKTMRENVVYFCVRSHGRIVSVASSEMDVDSQNVEMTDFATLSDYRGNGFAVHLLHAMEDAMSRRGIKTAYTIARAVSYGMNMTFAKLGYEYRRHPRQQHQHLRRYGEYERLA